MISILPLVPTWRVEQWGRLAPFCKPHFRALPGNGKCGQSGHATITRGKLGFPLTLQPALKICKGKSKTKHKRPHGLDRCMVWASKQLGAQTILYPYPVVTNSPVFVNALTVRAQPSLSVVTKAVAPKHQTVQIVLHAIHLFLSWSCWDRL